VINVISAKFVHNFTSESELPLCSTYFFFKIHEFDKFVR